MKLNTFYVSNNPHKVSESTSILEELGVKVEVALLSVPEIQAEDLSEVAMFRAKEAYRKLRRPVIVEDAGLFIDSLNGFPGPYSSYVFKTIGCDGILKIMRNVRNRRATFKSAAVFHDGRRRLVFIGEVKGKIAYKAKGASWGFDPIFEPNGLGGLTYAQLHPSFKNKISHRRRAFEKMVKYLLNKYSNGYEGTVGSSDGAY
ncbi:MAG: RdgB/HAM1 family non-canonical purine NTP pyrophosphatase [Candidatus Nezhaarchaeota archaeon]|nr:RdgB/HAM1 family non-canonical purine NTP pyrophosphatase [Candidatus Nezhaarchaeota archaeon]